MTTRSASTFVLAAALFAASLPAVLADPLPPSVDADGDNVPDAVEGQLCGRTATHDAINGAAPTAGTCLSNSDYAYVAPHVPVELVDADGDRVPDALEPLICSLQDRNTPADGTCGYADGSDPSNYYPPWAPAAPPPPPATTSSGDFVGTNGPGTLDVWAPDGQVFHASNPPGCCATTSIPSGVLASGHWTVHADLSCCGGWPRFAWTIAGWSWSTDFQCGPGAKPWLDLDYDARTWSVTDCGL